ncbi:MULTISPECIES: alpha/beta fold hydrolase [unclassified Fusibacter]|uniref:alpha/beta fold hydrolase n=1 Tax=unclassified Fusibacter TaxID=2624464 RepID=UPI0010125C03|nr:MULTISPECIES: alpha/beta hydrolase [unclassified Fusibacter]MCK8061039.1 alpha/beta hydrolase [Fusibacter sp. A2]NPE20507.1 alpha/beta hydrolase [Fusibacter sp. A1]RXV63707.1 alpha/beta hydrolase [Fusibacter sp. A1]
MNMKLIVLLVGITFALAACSSQVSEPSVGDVTESGEAAAVVEIKQEPYETVEILSQDGLVITADYYFHDSSSDYMLLMHQAGSSRGEFRESALRFLELGYNVLTIDLRSGESFEDVVNQTAALAVEQGIANQRTDAYQDAVAALKYIDETFAHERIFVLGSSYSCGLALQLGVDYPGLVDGILTFSASESVMISNQMIADNIEGLSIPVFFTSGKFEADAYNYMRKQVKSDINVAFLPEGNGVHGASSLLSSNENYLEYWEAVEAFLEEVKTGKIED